MVCSKKYLKLGLRAVEIVGWTGVPPLRAVAVSVVEEPWNLKMMKVEVRMQSLQMHYEETEVFSEAEVLI